MADTSRHEGEASKEKFENYATLEEAATLVSNAMSTKPKTRDASFQIRINTKPKMFTRRYQIRQKTRDYTAPVKPLTRSIGTQYEVHLESVILVIFTSIILF